MDKIPYHIQVMGRFISVPTKDKNLADGRIERRDFTTINFKFGGILPIFLKWEDGKAYQERWIAINKNYFKLVEKYLIQTHS